jgi:gamma-tubulin complex component 3
MESEALVVCRPGSPSRLLGDEFRQWLETATAQSSAHLIATLREKYNLRGHFKVIKQCLLMGQGDFIQTLIETCKDELSKPHYTIYEHNLMPLLEGAIRSSNCQYLPEKLRAGLRVRLKEKSHDYTYGWDVFYLYYQVESPVNAILTPEAMQTYMSIFNLLWRVKLLQQWLGQLWKEHLRLAQELPPALLTRFRDC